MLPIMNAEHFLAWLHVADLETTGDEGLRQIFEEVLEQAPDEAEEVMERFLDEIEDELDATHLNHDKILGWPKRYAGLLPDDMKALKKHEEAMEERIDEISDDQVESPRLERFQSCLEQLRDSRDEASVRVAWSQLESLEEGLAQAQAEYEAEGFDPRAVSAESVAGHRYLLEGFECWFEAFDLAKVGQAEEALGRAAEGNRLFRAVAEWSSEVSGS